MGIREHLSKELSKKDLKMSDLSLDEQEKTPELKFDPEQEITEQDWAHILASLEYMRENSDQRLRHSLTQAKILFPDRTEQLNLDQEIQKQFVSSIAASYKVNNVYGYTNASANYKTLYPNSFQEISEKDWTKMIDILELSSPKTGYLGLSYELASMKRLSPERFSQLDINEYWDKMRGSLEELKKASITQFAQMAANMKIIAPERFHESDITEDD